MDDVMKTKGMALLMWERFADSRGCGGKSAIGVGIWEISYRGGTHFTVSERRDCGGWSRYNIPAGMALILWAGIETHFEDYGCEPLVMAKASPFGR